MGQRSERPARTEQVGFALAFLDVLCCGLGSAILLLLVLPHGPSIAAMFIDESLADRIQRAAEEIESKKVETASLRSQIEAAEQDLAARSSAMDTLKGSRALRASELQTLLRDLAEARRAQLESADQLIAAQRERAAVIAAQQEEVEKLGSQGRGSHLAGISIAENRVAILLDRSASMLDRKLVEIIRLRISAQRLQQNAPKWRSARAAAEWAYSEIPPEGLYRILTYSNTVLDIDGTALAPTGALNWRKKSAISTRVGKEINAVTAGGPTDLRRALKAIARLEPSPLQVLLITDGLPSVPGDKRLRSIRKCPSQPKSGTAFLSPECRQNIFRDAERYAAKELPDAQFHVILLSLEGDASSAHSYWQFAAARGGRLLAPAEGWPLL